MKDAAPDLPLWAFALGINREGYHVRADGRGCPRGHHGIFRNNRHDCFQCRKIAAPSWRLIRRVGTAIRAGFPIPTIAVFVMGKPAETIRRHFLEGCQREGFAPEDYGRTWGIYHVQPIHVFDLTTTAGLRAANRLENLRVDRLHTAPQA
jgi:hypothetical protein